MRSLRIAGALTLGALAVPAAAAAHPSVYTDTARVLADPGDPASLVDQTRHVVTNHGFTFVLRETNGLGAPKGVITYSKLPGAYRATIPFSQWQAEGGTGAQPHATCQVAALETEAAIRAWQGDDPFYNYVPFQRAAAGLEDDPGRWIPVVKALTGVDLATVADPAAACAGLGGAYAPADAIQTSTAALNAGYLEHELAPVQAALADAEAARGTLQGLLDAARAEVARLVAAAAPLRVALPSATVRGRALARRGTSVQVSGPAGAAVRVRLALGERRARKLRLRTSGLGTAEATLGADGSATVVVPVKRTARKPLRRMRRAAELRVTLTAGDRTASTKATVTR